MDSSVVGTSPAGLEGTKTKCTRNLSLLLKTNKIRVCHPSAPWGLHGGSAANPEHMELPGELGCFEVQAHSFLLGSVSLGSPMERKAREQRGLVWELGAVLAGPLHRNQQG